MQRQLHEAITLGDVRLVRRIAVLLAIARGEELSQVEEQWAISHKTVYNWLAAFITHRWESLVYHKPAGRPAQLTKSQKQHLIQDGARYHTSKATREFCQQYIERLIVFQSPSYSPDYNPIEFLWKKVKTKATHNRYFAEFAKLIQSVEDALVILAAQTEEIIRLMGVYTKLLIDSASADPLSNSFS